MSLQAGDIVFNITGDDTQLKDALAKVKNHFAVTSKAVGVAMTAVGGAITGFAAAAVKDFVETGSAINDMAGRTGMGTTALQELGYAAGLSGGSMDDVEKAAKKMSKVIFEAGEESKTAGAKQAEAFAKGSKEIITASGANTDALSALGLSYEKLKGMKPEDQFKTIGFALADVKDATTRAALAQQMFGRAGTSLLPMLSEGKAGFQAMADEAHKLGLIMDEESVASADRLGDEWDKLKAGLRGLGFDIAEVLVPTLIELATDVRQIMETFSGWRKENPALFDSITQIVIVVGGLMVALGPLVMMMPGIATTFSLLGTAAGAAAGVAGVGGVAGLTAGFIAFTAAFGPAIVAIGIGIWSFAALTRAMGETLAAQAQLAESSKRLSDVEEQRNQKLRDKGVILDEAIMQEMTYEERIAYRTQQEQASADITLRGWIAHFAGRTATEEEFAAARNAALNENVTAQEAAMLAIQDAHGAAARTIAKADQQTTAALLESYGVRKRVQVQGAGELTQAEIKAATATHDAWLQADGAITMSASKSAEETKSIWQRAVEAIVGFLSPLFELIGVIGRGLGLLGPRTGGGPPGLATGGVVQRGGWAMVGERGPEMVRLPQGSTVYDARQTAVAGGGGGSNISLIFNVTGITDPAAFSRMAAQQLRLELGGRGL